MKKKIRIFIILILLLGVGIFFWNKKNDSLPDQVSISLENRDIKEEIYIPGNVYPVKEIELKSQISGVLDKIFVKIGDMV